ncbi:MBOAT, membrane-bound O-acyltransferase family-domain-containing protein [Tuber borchii]|uniref:O-acyltransferase n=1 Tax=Tuber borchii TaxID=42251 RepID=A0A2T6ZA33_TUBBO|nr:MBOAT, membrane-bound O-acyltransferase family-domain-containing protein [Tuber borchii]
MTSVSATSTSTSASVSVAISPDPTPGPQTRRSAFPSAISSTPPLQSPHKVTTRSNGDHRSKKVPKDPLESGEYKHAFAVHSIPRTSTLSHDSVDTPSFIGFRNLMVLVLIVGNLRLVIENYMKYGVLVHISGAEFRRDDLKMSCLLYCLIPTHLFVGFLVELIAAYTARGDQAKNKKSDNRNPKLQSYWRIIALAHVVNATLSLGVANWVVYYRIHHPLIGTFCEFHAVIVWLKQISYALTNRDLRDAFLEGAPTPKIYQSCPYPQNITVRNLCYFWWAPTLVYQPVYPRSPTFRWSFFLKRVGETIALSIAIWFLSAQYAVPVLQNSVAAIGKLDVAVILERLMKLSTVSLIIWLAGFFALFQSGLNALAELLRFGDREFYADWWNSCSVGTYWKTWNKPVNHFMRRHIYTPLLGRGWSNQSASVMVFTFSAILHELLVGVPTHNIIGVAFAGMIFQIPLIAITVPLEKMRGQGSIIGNAIFWVSFCLVGQPFAVLIYYFTWQAKFGDASRTYKL